MLRFPAKDRIRPAIHLTALIDIVFLLLVFFLLASSFVEQEGVAIVVPEVDSKGDQLLPQVSINIDRDGLISIKGVAVSEEQLVDILAAQLGQRLNDTVTVNADRRVEYDTVVKAIDAAKLAGAKNVLLVARRTVHERD